MRTCACCGETKQAVAFSRPGYNKKPPSNCLECGVWLRLFREAFGPTRDWKANREKTAIQCRERYWAKKRSAGVLLDTVWRNA